MATWISAHEEDGEEVFLCSLKRNDNQVYDIAFNSALSANAVYANSLQ